MVAVARGPPGGPGVQPWPWDSTVPTSVSGAGPWGGDSPGAGLESMLQSAGSMA
jgi:hypothetical protein